MTPQQVLTQRMGALALANAIRYAKSDLKREIASMSRPDAHALAATIFERGDHEYWVDAVEALRFRELLQAIPKIGYSKTTEIAQHAGVTSHERKIRDLTWRQRHAVAEVLRTPQTLWENSLIEVPAA